MEGSRIMRPIRVGVVGAGAAAEGIHLPALARTSGVETAALVDPAADRVIRELASTRSELIVLHVLSPQELDPQLEGDVRLVDRETGEAVDVTADLATVDAYRSRLTAWREAFAELATKRAATYVDLSTETPLNELIFAELRRRRVVA